MAHWNKFIFGIFGGAYLLSDLFPWKCAKCYCPTCDGVEAGEKVEGGLGPGHQAARLDRQGQVRRQDGLLRIQVDVGGNRVMNLALE